MKNMYEEKVCMKNMYWHLYSITCEYGIAFDKRQKVGQKLQR